MVGRIEQASFLGDRLECAVRLGDHRILLNASPGSGIDTGDLVHLSFPSDSLRVWRD
jgi:hypothetical protein